MDKETIHEQIEILIATLKEQHEGMMDQHKFISKIDIDLFLENIRDLYEFSIVLGKMNERDKKQNQGHQIDIAQPKKEAIKESVAEPNMKSEKKSESPTKINTPKEKKVNIINSGVLFEEIALDMGQKPQDMAVKQDAIADLKAAIGINEKFIFMNELFDGNLEEYNTSMDLLNNCQSASEAEQQIFLELQPKYHWDMNSKVVKSLMQLVDRRFN